MQRLQGRWLNMWEMIQGTPGLGSSLGASLAKGMEKGSEFANKMKLEEMKRKQGMGDFSKYFKGAPQGTEGQEQTAGSALSGMDPMQKAAFAQEFPKAYKVMQEEEDKAQDLKGIHDTLDWLDENTKYSGTFGVPINWGGIEAQGDSTGLGLKDSEGNQMSNPEIQSVREGIDSSGIWAADKVYTHFNKGVLNKEKWEDVKMKFAPSAKLPSYINKARTAALRRIMGLKPNSSPAAVNAVIEKEKKALTKIEKSKGSSEKELTDDVLDRFLDAANEDSDKAAEMAKAEGYSW